MLAYITRYIREAYDEQEEAERYRDSGARRIHCAHAERHDDHPDACASAGAEPRASQQRSDRGGTGNRFQRRARAFSIRPRATPGAIQTAMSEDILDLGLIELATAIRKRKISSLEATRACLDRAQHLQPHLNCFISIEADAALKAARTADRALARGAKPGLLHGVPLAHKDLFYRKGQISTGGAKILRDYRPQVTATVVDRMQAAGAIWLGTLNMSEFAGNPTGHNEHFGDCRNAWNVQHVSGGSSSGSGVAVAGRLCYG